jgi:acyl carrier protein
MGDVKATLRDFILSKFLPGEPAASLKDDAPLRSSGILDSMGTIQMVEFVESQFGLNVEAHEADEAHFGSIDRIEAFIERKRKRR